MDKELDTYNRDTFHDMWVDYGYNESAGELPHVKDETDHDNFIDNPHTVTNAMNLYESSQAISLYDLFNETEIEAFHCWFNFYSPSRDDYEWLEIHVKLRLNDYCLQLGLYNENVIRQIFQNLFGLYTVTDDPIQRGGETGKFYCSSFIEGKPYPSEENRSRVNDIELQTIRYKVIRKLRIEALKLIED